MKVVIIGSGPGGYKAAMFAKMKGLDVTLVEKKKIGGTCLNVGCIPTKALLYAAGSVYAAKKFGTASADVEKITAHRDKTVNTLRSGLEKQLTKMGINIINGEAEFKDGTVFVNGEKLTYDKLILATGSAPFIPPIDVQTEILDSDKVLFEGTKLPEGSVGIIGGGVIGVELACFFAMLGRQVYIFELAPKILPPAPPSASSRLTAYLKKMGVKILTNVKVVSITEGNGKKKVNLENGDAYEVDNVLMAVGRKRNTDGFENLGLKLERGKVITDEYLKAAENIYAIGDIATNLMLAHTAEHHAHCVVETITGNPTKVETLPIPSVVYTHPEVAWVGENKGKVKRLVLGNVGRAVAINTEGSLELYLDDEGYIKGFVMVGDGASELVNLAATAIAEKIKAEEFKHIVFAHPTISEALKMAVEF